MNPKIQQLLNFSIINIDKPSGPTSFTVSDYIRKRFKNDIGCEVLLELGALNTL